MITEIILGSACVVLFVITSLNFKEISELRGRLRDSKIVWGEQTRATSADVFGLTKEMRLYNTDLSVIKGCINDLRNNIKTLQEKKDDFNRI